MNNLKLLWGNLHRKDRTLLSRMARGDPTTITADDWMLLGDWEVNHTARRHLEKLVRMGFLEFVPGGVRLHLTEEAVSFLVDMNQQDTPVPKLAPIPSDVEAVLRTFIKTRDQVTSRAQIDKLRREAEACLTKRGLVV